MIMVSLTSVTQMFPCECCEISMNTFLYRTPLVTASELVVYKFDTVCKDIQREFISLFSI